MNWRKDLVRAALFALVFALLGHVVVPMPLPRALASGIMAGIVWVILGHWARLFR
ncbi:MAG: hypothetical protein H0Z37_00730 [Firmicutes bacterium]|nr:hypothetical protein [Bacillota bacterium]